MSAPITFSSTSAAFFAGAKTAFLAGDQWGLILQDGAILAGYAVGLLGLARAVTRKRLD